MTMSVFAKLTLTEFKLMMREPLPAFFVLLFPTVLVVILGSIPSFRDPSADLGGMSVIDLYVGISVALVIAMVALQVTPSVLSNYRERGVLRRLATTPVSPLKLLGAQLTMSLICAILSAVLVLAVGRIAFGVKLAGQFPGFVLAFLLCTLAVLGIGVLIAALAPNGKAGNAIGTVLFFPSMFFAGLWTPREVMPHVLQRIGDFTPLGAGERALHDAMSGNWPNMLSVTVLAAYAIVFGLASSRLFRWS
jgi:ABC-2 type transport system permease protein